jgi:hypothetical protein
MSRDPDNWYEEEYWEEIGRQEDIAKAARIYPIEKGDPLFGLTLEPARHTSRRP